MLKNYDEMSWQTHAGWLLACTFALIVMVLLGELVTVEAWRHDSLFYEDSYFHKLVGEGRWVNYFLQDGLRLVPGAAGVLLVYFSTGIFFFKAAMRISDDAGWSLAVTSLVLMLPHLALQALWPVVSMPWFMGLALAPYAADRLPKPVFFGLFAIFFFGTSHHLYFLLPLLFIGQLSWKGASNLVVQWLLFFFVGFAVAQLITLSITGSWITPADWRSPAPVSSFADLVDNLKASAAAAQGSFVQFQVHAGLWWLAPVGMLLVFGRAKVNAPSVAVVALVILAVYVSVAPYGLTVADRTAFVPLSAFVFALVIRRRMKFWVTSVVVVSCIILALVTGRITYQTLSWYTAVTGVSMASLRAQLPKQNRELKVATFLITPRGWSEVIGKISFCEDVSQGLGEGLEHWYRMRPILLELGFKYIRGCSECEGISEPVARLSREGCQYQPFEVQRASANEWFIFASERYLR